MEKRDTGLRVANSLSGGDSVPFVPRDGNVVNWYICGPTVYAPSHVGHARTYLTFDIMRRIMVDYFGYNVFQVMNVTDIDDKIILRAEEQNMSTTDLSRRFEAEFFEDLQLLGVMFPDVILRVSEHIPDIVEYIAKIIENGFAYPANGSVYFDVASFAQSSDHTYAKLVPSQMSEDDQMDLLSEGEGKLACALGKRNPRDFALWKAAKEGEPFWDSPWGKGRPGWHIECSTLAATACGEHLDVHVGGVDLRFPHHDNEIAQSEARFGHDDWVNHFWHAGHLHIGGRKMSKSLKNFITIREALKTKSEDGFTADELRMFFVMHKWDGDLDWSEDSLGHARDTIALFRTFFSNMEVLTRSWKKYLTAIQKWDEPVQKLDNSRRELLQRFDDDLKNNFNTPAAFASLVELTKAVNQYIHTVKNDAEGRFVINPLIVENIVNKIKHLIRIFGFVDIVDTNANGAQSSDVLPGVLDSLCEFRDTVRIEAKKMKSQELLGLTDQFRDDVMPKLGVRLEDITEKSLWKLESPDVLMKERENKIAEAERIRKVKEEAKRSREEAAKKKAEVAKIPPNLFFIKMNESEKKWVDFDEAGMPLHSVEGKDLSKSEIKKLGKLLNQHKKTHDAYLASLK